MITIVVKRVRPIIPLLLILALSFLTVGCQRSQTQTGGAGAEKGAIAVTPGGLAQPTPKATSTAPATATLTVKGSNAIQRKAGQTPSPRLTPSATPTLTQTPLVVPTLGPTVAADLALEFTSVRPDEFLSTVAARYGVSVDDIVKFSVIENPDFVAIGQGLIIPHRTSHYTPVESLLPDSEFVYGLGYVDFDIAEFIDSQGGYLASFTMRVAGGKTWSGADVIERIARRYSIGPRVLLALLEAKSGWVTNPEPEQQAIDRPLGHNGGATGLLAQFEWAANALNKGFYGWLDRGETAIRFHNGVLARGAPGLNPATVAIHRMLARDIHYKNIEAETTAFSEAYNKLFGDPWALDAGPVLPAGLEQPALQLPWTDEEIWYLTGGPHGGWGSGSSWAALDFVPDDVIAGSCEITGSWAAAAAPGVVALNTDGELLIDLDMDGDIRTGWVLQYLHISDRVAEGTVVEAGDPVGRPSCAGGFALSSHLHVARRFNGVWVAADGPAPFVLGNWQTEGDFEYFGRLIAEDGRVAEACDCRNEKINRVTW